MKNVKYTRLGENLEDDSEVSKARINCILIGTILIFLTFLCVFPFDGILAKKKYKLETTTKNKLPSFQDYYFTKCESQHLNCSEFINGNQKAIDLYASHGRIKLDRFLNLSMDCDSIRTRLFNDLPLFEELKRSILFVRNVYQSYELQEVFLLMNYHPDHYFCYAMDSKSDEKFKTSMRRLAGCFGNVYVLEKEYDFDKAGHHQDEAHFDCIEELLAKNWNHAITLQNFDLILKTPEQLSELSDILNYTSIMGSDNALTERYDVNASWTPAGMKLFKNENEVPKEILHQRLVVRKSLNQVILSKVFVNAIFEKINLKEIMKRFDNPSLFGVDEMMIMTLFENYLGLDGQMESNCTEAHEDELTRFTDWDFNQPDGPVPECKSKWLRHSICVLGVEYLKDLSNSPMILANKVVESFDFGTVLCIREMMKTKKMGRIPDSDWLSARFPQFREMQMKKNGTYDKGHFNCSTVEPRVE